VSHQVKALERHVGAALFERVPRGVRLTDAGARLFAGVHGALLDVAQALDALRPAPAAGALTLSTTHSFAALWLVPRLGRFYEAHPQYQLRLDASAESVDLLQDASVDVAVRYSRRRFPDLHTACRLQEWFGVYGAPALVARQGRRAPALVTVRWRDSPLYEQGWQDWCEAAGLPAWRRPATVHAYTEEHYALQAAIAGQGLVLASSAMVSDSVAAGTLAAYRPEVRVQGAAYTALCAPGRERHPPVKAFLAWLREEFKN
jgi:DNA-binding transcriptional LysR family regulator